MIGRAEAEMKTRGPLPDFTHFRLLWAFRLLFLWAALWEAGLWAQAGGWWGVLSTRSAKELESFEVRKQLRRAAWRGSLHERG